MITDTGPQRRLWRTCGAADVGGGKHSVVTTSLFTYRGDRMAYTRCGSGKPILMLHNGGTSKEIWSRQVTDLSNRYDVICLDLLGFGESDLPQEGYSIDEYVDRLSAFIDHLQVERISVVGNCMGSAMSLLLAADRPGLFESLVLINPLTENTARRGLTGWVMWLPARFPRLSKAVARRVFVPRFLARLVVAAQFGPRHWVRGLLSPPDGAIESGATWRVRGRLTTMAEMFADTTALADVDRLRPGADFPPFAVVWGASNLGLSPKAGRALNRSLRPDYEECLIGCGHLPTMENPERVSQIIDEFVGNSPVRHNSNTRISA